MKITTELSIRAKIVERLKTRSGGIRGNMTPMIDIVFLLLVFFVATARFRPQEGRLPMLLPPPQGGQMGQFSLVEPLLITLNSQGQSLIVGIEGRRFVYDTVTTPAMVSLGDELTAIYVSQKRNSQDPIELDCGATLSWEHLVKFYNLMYGMGATNITFLLDSSI